jgi:subtilisin family serine protease
MRRICFAVSVGVWVAVGLAMAPPVMARSAPLGTPPVHAVYVPGQLIVEFRAGVTARDRAAALRAAGAAIVHTLPTLGQNAGRLVVAESSTLGTDSLEAALARDPLVVKACPNTYCHVDSTPSDDPGLIEQWGLTQIAAPQAWETTVGSPNVVVASIDTGVDCLHPDLAANMWKNPGEIPGNGIDDDGNGYVDDVYGIDTVNHDSNPMDDFGHGTHTSGIIAAVGDNSMGVAGTGWQTHIMALKFLDFDGWGTAAEAIECIDYVVREKLDYGVTVVAINASWGFPRPNPLLRDAIERAGEAGIVFCASAGNYGVDTDKYPHYPSSFDCKNILSVAATTPHDRLVGWSNWGPRRVDLGAPGVEILSTLPQFPIDLGWSENQPMYASWSGTSMATPFVAGTVALCATVYPDETVSQRIHRILSSVDRLPSLRGRCVTGGRLDVSAALGEGPVGGDHVPPQTQVIGCDSRWHDAPVTLRFWASDGVGGSGVATTRWRLNDSAWHRGSLAVVPALRNTKVTYAIDYRSIDRAGNVEPLQNCQVNIDTTGPADGDVPGVPLPASPVVGDVGRRRDHDDVYSVPVMVGESLRVVETGVPGMTPRLSLYPPSANVLDGPPVATATVGADGSSLTYCAETSGTYYLDVRAAGQDGSYRLVWDVTPVGVDVTPPYVTVELPNTNQYGVAWFNRPVALAVLADDGPLGSGIGSVEASMDDGVTWTAGAHPIVPAPADHSNDGVHLIRYRATDLAGNTSPPLACLVSIDTAGPDTQTWAPVQAVRRGDWVRIRVKLADLTSRVKAQLVIKSVATGGAVETYGLGWWRTGSRSWWLRCNLPAGKYSVLIAGTTHDEAGNLWESAVCQRDLRVR